ncbi:piggyBac transposable element-derived protein 3-like [Ixodes scapularis]|uniref:piggyBac transposable element-derived protein 3-like n=1 Tax=Ixodes scapularis TaxID=6945 RepID=UPI001AD65AA1|nr:piggyBac transposable element-derived protein 3-like [Ixodes scapularis]
MAEPSTSGIAIKTRAFYGWSSSKTEAHKPRNIVSYMPTGYDSDLGDYSEQGQNEYIPKSASNRLECASNSTDDSSEDESDDARRCPMKQYMPGKPNPWGIKLWGRVGSSGFLHQFDVYQGQIKRQNFGLGGDVAIKRCEHLPHEKGYKVAADTFFASIALAAEFYKKGLGIVGTLGNNRLKDCRLKTESDLKRLGRGAFDYAVDNTRSVAVIKRFDNRAVTLVSNYASTEPVCTVRGWDKKETMFTQVEQPGVVATYYSFMGGVDLLNYLSELYKFPIISRTWYIYLFYHTLMVATVNACLLYTRNCAQLDERHVNLRRFQADVA